MIIMDVVSHKHDSWDSLSLSFITGQKLHGTGGKLHKAVKSFLIHRIAVKIKNNIKVVSELSFLVGYSVMNR